MCWSKLNSLRNPVFKSKYSVDLMNSMPYTSWIWVSFFSSLHSSHPYRLISLGSKLLYFFFLFLQLLGVLPISYFNMFWAYRQLYSIFITLLRLNSISYRYIKKKETMVMIIIKWSNKATVLTVKKANRMDKDHWINLYLDFYEHPTLFIFSHFFFTYTEALCCFFFYLKHYFAA